KRFLSVVGERRLGEVNRRGALGKRLRAERRFPDWGEIDLHGPPFRPEGHLFHKVVSPHVIDQRATARRRNELQQLWVAFLWNRQWLERESSAPEDGAATADVAFGAEDHPVRGGGAVLMLVVAGFGEIRAEGRG